MVLTSKYACGKQNTHKNIVAHIKFPRSDQQLTVIQNVTFLRRMTKTKLSSVLSNASLLSEPCPES